jgi:hypothetical protein
MKPIPFIRIDTLIIFIPKIFNIRDFVAVILFKYIIKDACFITYMKITKYKVNENWFEGGLEMCAQADQGEI